MPSPNWRTLLAASAIFTIHAANLRATPSTDNTPVYRPILFAEFQRMVLAGEEIKGRLVPSDYIERVLEDADENLLKRLPDARLRLKSCKVTDGTVQIRKHLGDGKNKQAVYLALPIDISHTDFDANLYLEDVVIEKRITLDDIDLRKSVSFQGAVFRDELDLTRVRFWGVTNFSGAFLEKASLGFKDCEFQFQANFANLTIPSGSGLYIGGDRISVPLDFSGSHISGTLTLQGRERTLEVEQIVYLNGVNSGPGVPVGKLSLGDIVLHETVYMDQSKWAQLHLAESEDKRHRPIRFLQFCDLRQGQFDTVDLSGTEFERGGDFSGSVFQTAINLERTKFRQPVRMTWCQLKGKLRPLTPSGNTSDSNAKSKLSVQSYEELERNFEKLGDTKSQNKCYYDKRRKHERVNIEWLISGYWVVPCVPLLWVSGFFLTFYCINWNKFDRWFGLKKPAAATHFAPEPLVLTFKATFRWFLPNEYWGTVLGQWFYLGESLVLKVLLGICIFTLKNASPLLKELLPYWLPK